jgi:ketosteroid isomerase-like protein
MELEAAVRAWIEGWSRAWAAADADAVAALYAEDAVYRTHPFREAHRGPAGARAYARDSFASETLVACRFGEPVVAHSRAAVEYWATLITGDGEDVTIAGLSFVRFDPDGRCTEHRDYWAITPGHREPPTGWGR